MSTPTGGPPPICSRFATCYWHSFNWNGDVVTAERFVEVPVIGQWPGFRALDRLDLATVLSERGQ